MNSRDDTPFALDELEKMADSLERKMESVEALGVAVSDSFVRESKTLIPILADIREKVIVAGAHFHY